jgi:hypothetical protein
MNLMPDDPSSFPQGFSAARSLKLTGFAYRTRAAK